MSVSCTYGTVRYVFRFSRYYCHANAVLPASIKYKEASGGREVRDGLLLSEYFLLFRLCERHIP